MLFLFCFEWPTTPGELGASSRYCCVLFRNRNTAAFRGSSASWKIEPLHFNTVIFVVPLLDIPLTTSHGTYSAVFEISWCAVVFLELLSLDVCRGKKLGSKRRILAPLHQQMWRKEPASSRWLVWFQRTWRLYHLFTISVFMATLSFPHPFVFLQQPYIWKKDSWTVFLSWRSSVFAFPPSSCLSWQISFCMLYIT